ncbi:unnamed protein product [Lactuca saligna]|uniref:ABC1 atypical kinase-like domain-containing protein n=1 Tax=Lactuca saligna TaxID=75948 RepID=A0AA35YDS1_LACSI|nr:unnamed protein product [Lactuca saligna]
MSWTRKKYNQFDDLPPFSIGIPSINVDINDAAYLRLDHNEGAYVEERTTKPSPSPTTPPVFSRHTDEVSYSGQQPLLPPPSFTLFTELTTSPIAAASLGQVYKGRLKENGDLVDVFLRTKRFRDYSNLLQFHFNCL